jgi:hypothetical protein
VRGCGPPFPDIGIRIRIDRSHQLRIAVIPFEEYLNRGAIVVYTPVNDLPHNPDRGAQPVRKNIIGFGYNVAILGIEVEGKDYRNY